MMAGVPLVAVEAPLLDLPTWLWGDKFPVERISTIN